MSTINVSLPASFTYTCPKSGTVTVLDTSKMIASIDFLVGYGLTQKLSDCHAGLGEPGTTKANAYGGTKAEWHRAVDAAVADMVERIYAGTLSERAKIDPDKIVRARLRSKGWTDAQIDSVLNDAAEVVAPTPKSPKKAA